VLNERTYPTPVSDLTHLFPRSRTVVAYTVVHLVTPDCTRGVIDPLYHSRHNDRVRQYECDRGIRTRKRHDTEQSSPRKGTSLTYPLPDRKNPNVQKHRPILCAASHYYGGHPCMIDQKSADLRKIDTLTEKNQNFAMKRFMRTPIHVFLREVLGNPYSRSDQNDAWYSARRIEKKRLVFCPFLRGPWSAENFCKVARFPLPIPLPSLAQIHPVSGKIYAKMSVNLSIKNLKTRHM